MISSITSPTCGSGPRWPAATASSWKSCAARGTRARCFRPMKKNRWTSRSCTAFWAAATRPNSKPCSASITRDWSPVAWRSFAGRANRPRAFRRRGGNLRPADDPQQPGKTGRRVLRPRRPQAAVNQALTDLNKAKKLIRESQLPSSEWQKHKVSLDEASRQMAAIDGKLGDLSRQKSRLQRLAGALPAIGRLGVRREAAAAGRRPGPAGRLCRKPPRHDLAAGIGPAGRAGGRGGNRPPRRSDRRSCRAGSPGFPRRGNRGRLQATERVPQGPMRLAPTGRQDASIWSRKQPSCSSNCGRN